MSHSWSSPNYGERRLPLDMIVLHYTGMQSANAALERLCDPISGVSAHYLIEEDGTLHCLVDPTKRAWHAGVSYWEGARDINSRSIGIELVNPGHDFGYRPFPKAQIETLLELLKRLCGSYSISRAAVWGHSDIAPTRKEDPGEKFPWARLAAHGFGIWPSQMVRATKVSPRAEVLSAIGYDVSDLGAAERAFKRHFRPMHCLERWSHADTVRACAVLQALQRVRLRRRT